ncbi:MAG: hypothetical protein A2653_01000 [Candidatus Zambryskibacteria bacterium RIFCSPHIGHO2_01_FULL_43_25]|nr:MAG: hypothetical protein A2653_01000 [Candidatus Zambryskibacteria bacterium RIFCSPHIGHO2_01_FULL_43_25]OHB00908.1 MAG: hypothetical protein A3E94_01500 [Candidatus Zambryskibacteria bacterium RIFCSPHIGHO2_12_FULL_44_12b]
MLYDIILSGNAQSPNPFQEAIVRTNINEYVWVKLTPDGLAIHREYYEHLDLDYSRYQPQIDTSSGRARFQMYELMLIFGPHLKRVPFEDNAIYFSEIYFSDF